MKLDLNELKNYPELLSKEQVRIVGHMSKRTALYLIQSKLRRMPQLLSVADVAGFTGYVPSTVTQWIRAEKLEAFDMLDRYLIPKPCLLDWISSSKYNHIERKSKKHLKALWTIAKM